MSVHPDPIGGLASNGHPDAARPVWCEVCGDPASEADWSYVAQMIVCPLCLEGQAEASTAPFLSESQL